MADSRSRKQSGTPAGGQFAVGVRAESTVQLHAPADPATEVTVPNPDDPFDMPIYEGPAAGAAAKLVPGSYAAFGVDDTDAAYLLTVPDPGRIEWQDAPELGPAGARASIDGTAVTKAMAFTEDDPEDLTRPRQVTMPGATGQVYFSFDDSGWRTFLTGGGHTSVQDTEDAAVRALVAAARRRS